MPSTDVDGSPVLIINQSEALRIRVVMTQVILDKDEQAVFNKITYFLRDVPSIFDALRRPADVETPRGAM